MWGSTFVEDSLSFRSLIATCIELVIGSSQSCIKEYFNTFINLLKKNTRSWVVDLVDFNFLNSLYVLGTRPGGFQFLRLPNSKIGDSQIYKSSSHHSYRVRNLVGINHTSKGPLLPSKFELKSS